MKKLPALTLCLGFLMCTGSALADDTTGKDAMAKDSMAKDGMKKDAMAKDEMKK